MLMVLPRKYPGAIKPRLHYQIGLQGESGPEAFETPLLPPAQWQREC